MERVEVFRGSTLTSCTRSLAATAESGLRLQVAEVSQDDHGWYLKLVLASELDPDTFDAVCRTVAEHGLEHMNGWDIF